MTSTETEIKAAAAIRYAHVSTSPAERKSRGKALREAVPLDSHAVWKPPAHRPSPIDILRAQDATRQANLVPLRYGRMLQTPFTFYRGSAAVMAADLATTPNTGIHVQACGDCHLLNFGGFATPERRILFDINDLDETLPAPWEWDVKRLVASFILAAKSIGLTDEEGRETAVRCARSYRKSMRDFADMNVLDIWYASIDDADMLAMLPDDRKDFVRRRIAKAMAQPGAEVVYSELVDVSGASPRIMDQPPTIYHLPETKSAAFIEGVFQAFDRYRETLPDDRRVLLDRYRIDDMAVKVVGIGSVGTLCAVLLLTSLRGDPLFLQVKEANASVLEPYAGASSYRHHGQRVVEGQRLIQPAGDIFLGWVTGQQGKQFYLRQLRDAKIKPLIETFDEEMLSIYAKACGMALARAHAKAGDPWQIAGYLGKQDTFDEAMGSFAVAYAKQASRDHAALKAAVRAGDIEVTTES